MAPLPSMLLALRARPALAWSAAATLAAIAFGHFYLNYDTFYALVWGRGLAAGESPDYDVLLAPTPHPLLTLVGAALSPFGEAAPALMSALVAAAWVALIVAAYLLGTRLFGPWAGVVAAAALATRVPIASWAARGYVDIPFLALVVGAAALEARRPRAGTPVLALLAAAGLLRPEAWLLAGLYWLWLWPGRDRIGRLKSAAIVAAAPIAWAAFDLITAGDPLASLTGTRENVEILQRRTGLDDVPYTLARWLGYLTREPGVVGAFGAIAAVLWLPGRARLPAAVFWAGAGTFALYGLAGLPLISRYLTVPATMLLVFCGAGLAGWTLLADGPVRRRWRAGAIVAAIALVALFPWQVARLADLRSSSALRERIQSDLRGLAEDPAAQEAFQRCPKVYLPNHRPVPILAWWLDRPPSDFVSAAVERPRRGAFVAPATETVRRAFILDRRDLRVRDAEVPPEFNRVTSNQSWILYEQC